MTGCVFSSHILFHLILNKNLQYLVFGKTREKSNFYNLAIRKSNIKSVNIDQSFSNKCKSRHTQNEHTQFEYFLNTDQETFRFSTLPPSMTNI